MKTDIFDDLKNKGPEPIYLFHGDEFLAKELVQRFVSEYLDPGLRDTNLIFFAGAGLNLSDLSSQLFTPSLFGGSRIIVVEQTPIFMARSDRRKLVSKVVESWRTGDRKASLKAFGQLLQLVGVDASAAGSGSDWSDEILGGSLVGEDADILNRVIQAWRDEGKTVPAAADEAFLEEIVSSSFPRDTVLIFTAPGVDRRKKLFKLVEKRGRVVECTVLKERYGARIDRSFFDHRVREIVGNAGKKISGAALNAMYSRTGDDMRKLNSEVEKLIRYLGDRKEITPKDVEEVFEDFHEAAFYELNRALRTADITQCLPALHENLKIVDHPLVSLAVIANEFRKLMVARELLFTVFRSSWKRGMSYEQFKGVALRVRQENPEMTGKGKLNLLSMKDYPLYLALKDAQRFSMDRLIRIMGAVLNADVMMKSSRVGHKSPQSIVEDLVREICRPSKGKNRPGATMAH